MSTDFVVPVLPDWEPTRRTLHLYSRVIGVVPRVHAPSHPKWWQISLRMTDTGLITCAVPRPEGGFVRLGLDLGAHMLFVDADDGSRWNFDMAAGLSARAMAAQVHATVAELGLPARYPPEKYVDDQPTEYDPGAAQRYFTALTAVHTIFAGHRRGLPGEVGPIQLWPHGFDLAFEWFGTKTVEATEDGATHLYPAQLNLGFYPGDAQSEAYFYSSPFPFADTLADAPLPDGATWHTDGWQGAYLPYATVAGAADGPARLRDFARRVYTLARPTLTA